MGLKLNIKCTLNNIFLRYSAFVKGVLNKMPHHFYAETAEPIENNKEHTLN